MSCAGRGARTVRAVFDGCPGASDVVILPDSSKAFVACSGGHQMMAIALARASQPAGRNMPPAASCTTGKAPTAVSTSASALCRSGSGRSPCSDPIRIRICSPEPSMLPRPIPMRATQVRLYMDEALRAGLTVRNYGFFCDLSRYENPKSNTGYLPISKEPFAENKLQAVSTNKSLMALTDPYFRSFDQNAPDYYRFKDSTRLPGASRQRVVVVDARPPIAEVHGEILRVVRERLGVAANFELTHTLFSIGANSLRG